jgi:anti-sigma regulatory factor (Ser/Thr protein kinase)
MTAAIEQFIHPGLLYRDAEDYLAGTVPFIEEGLAAGEPVAVAVPTENLAALQEALGTHGRRVLWRDMTEVGRNPGRIIPTVLLAFADAHAGRRVRIIGEPIWAGRSSAEYPACAQHEALINAAFVGRPVTILCPYDVTRLDAGWVEDAYRTHPVMWDATGRFDSPRYTDPVAVAADFNQPLPDPPADAASMQVDMHALAALRQFVAGHAARAGLSEQQTRAATLAVNELAANSIEHAGGTGTLAVWTSPQHLVCQLTDAGQLTDPLTGRIPVPPDALGGRGLLLVNQLCDLVRVHTSAAGTTIRIHLSR